jgi:hypothetical protein
MQEITQMCIVATEQMALQDHHRIYGRHLPKTMHDQRNKNLQDRAEGMCVGEDEA